MHSKYRQVACCCKLSCTSQVVTPAGAGTAKASEAAQTGTATAGSPSATAASSTATAASASATLGANQQGQIIGVRTLLEFVAWLVCASLNDSSASAAQGKLRAAAAPAGPARRGAAFLTEELSSVGMAVRRMQVSNHLSCRKKGKDYAFLRHEKPSIILGCPGLSVIPCCGWSVCIQCSAVNLTLVMTNLSGRQAASVCWDSSRLSGLLSLSLQTLNALQSFCSHCMCTLRL